jgi:hypothetical protein
MTKAAERRAKIIAEQAARELAERTSGKLPPLPVGKSNWAATTSPRRRKFQPPRAGRPKTS